MYTVQQSVVHTQCGVLVGKSYGFFLGGADSFTHSGEATDPDQLRSNPRAFVIQVVGRGPWSLGKVEGLPILVYP